jgi:hypothetical protein
MGAALVGILVGLLIVILAIGIPYWHTHRHMRPQHDPAEMQAYQRATGRSAERIAAGAPGRAFGGDGRAELDWRAAHAGVDPRTGEPAPKTGSPGWPDGTG